MSPSGPKKGPLFLCEEESRHSAEHQAFAALLERFDHGFTRGQVIHGTPTRYESDGVLVDINAKMLAFLPNREIFSAQNRETPLEELVPLNERMEFYVVREDEKEERFVLSRKRVGHAQAWDKLKDVMDADQTIECPVMSTVKGGMLVDAMGLRGFVPSSHLRARDNFEALIGQTLPFKIINLDKENNSIILSHRKVVSAQMAEQSKEAMNTLQEGVIMEGAVVRLTEFGAFVDLGGVDGLLPLSQMSWRWVEHPSDVLNVGDKLQVQVISVDSERNRISLSVKSLTDDPWKSIGNEMKLGDFIKGKITRIKNFGAFVEIYPGVEALLPQRDMNEQESIIGRKFEPKDEIEVYIGKFYPDERRISLTFSQPHFGGGGHYNDHYQDEAANV